jgi:hypothetical protein
MNFAFFKWLHDELVALRAAVARLESHTGAPESVPAVKPDVTPADFGPPPIPKPTAPVAPDNGPSVTDLLFGKPDPNAPKPDPAPASAVVDTSADVLDFNVVGGGRAIDLTGPKTIINCPAHVVVTVVQASGQSGAHNSYTVVVNGNSTFMPNVQSEYLSSNYGLDITGPNVVVSVDSPGLQMQIHAV